MQKTRWQINMTRVCGTLRKAGTDANQHFGCKLDASSYMGNQCSSSSMWLDMCSCISSHGLTEFQCLNRLKLLTLRERHALINGITIILLVILITCISVETALPDRSGIGQTIKAYSLNYHIFTRGRVTVKRSKIWDLTEDKNIHLLISFALKWFHITCLISITLRNCDHNLFIYMVLLKTVSGTATNSGELGRARRAIQRYQYENRSQVARMTRDGRL